MTDLPQPHSEQQQTPYQLARPAGMPRDLIVGRTLNLEFEEREWVPQADGVWFRPLLFGLGGGYYVNLLRVRRSGLLSRHRHSGPVHAFVLRGRWHYLERDWIAEAGTYAFEPPGDTHTLVVPDDVTEMVTLFHVTGVYVYVDPYGKALGYEDVYTKIGNARRHYQSVGLGASFADALVR